MAFFVVVAVAVGLIVAVVAAFVGADTAAPLTVTRGVIFLIVAAEMPAFDKSLTEEYGRPAMIFFAVADPTPGRLSKSFSLAVFKSTFAVVSDGFVELAVAGFGVFVFLDVWAAETPAVRTLNATNATVKQRKILIFDFVIPFSFCAALRKLTLVRLVCCVLEKLFRLLAKHIT